MSNQVNNWLNEFQSIANTDGVEFVNRQKNREARFSLGLTKANCESVSSFYTPHQLNQKTMGF